MHCRKQSQDNLACELATMPWIHTPVRWVPSALCDCCVQERRVAMTAPQAALYDAAVQQFRADAANASGPQPDEGHAFMCMLWMLLTCGESCCSWEDS
jgi:hypothetical protein